MNKIQFISILFLAAAGSITEPRVYAPDVYMASALPDKFSLPPSSMPDIRQGINQSMYQVDRYRTLNNNGIVIGCIAPTKEHVYTQGISSNPYAGANAAYWSEKTGLKNIDLSSYQSAAYAINDKDIIAGSSYTAANSKELSFVWDMATGLVTVGPVGHVLAINDKNEVLVDEKVWEIKDNTVTFDVRKTSFDTNFDKTWKPYLGWQNTGYSNKKLNTVIVRDDDIYLTTGNGNKLLSSPNDNIKIDAGSIFINDNDEVIALSYKLSSAEKIMGQDKKIFSITKWRIDGLPTTSEPISNIPELKDYLYDMDLKGFNNQGQVLLLAKKSGNSNVSARLFLLTPRG